MAQHTHQRLHQRRQQEGQGPVDNVENTAEDIRLEKMDEVQDSNSPGVEIRAPEPSVVYHTVFTTMGKTFDGEIGGYSTVGSDNAPGTAAAAAQATDNPAANLAGGSKAHSPEGGNVNTLPGELKPTDTKGMGDGNTLAMATGQPTTSHKTTASAAHQTTSADSSPAAASSSAPASSDSSSTDTSAGAKAGIAIGVLGGVLIIGMLVWFILNKRKKKMQQQQQAADNEKSQNPFSEKAAAPLPSRPWSGQSQRSVQTARTAATAPRVDLRPNSEFMPNFAERRSSRSPALALTVTPEQQNQQDRGASGSMWERPGTAHSNQQANPFGDHAAERSVSPNPPANAQPHNPFEAPEHMVGMASTHDVSEAPSTRSVSPISTDEPATGAAAATAAGVGAAAAVAATGAGVGRSGSVTRKDGPAPLDLTRLDNEIPSPPSPAGTEFSQTSMAPGQTPGPSKSAAAIAAAGGPSSSVVHRVQLDFKPTLEDEMGLRAGQLVRLLHEYDDGWALCIRLDRSAQGVVPRTCLSTRPVKPRPAAGGPRSGPPVNPSGPRGPPRGPPGPGSRPMTPQGRPESPMRPFPPGGRPQSPAHMRPQSPAHMRPQSPAHSRPQSPAMQQQRPQSPGAMNRRHSPPGPGPSPMNPHPQGSQGNVNRKPIPGQAY